MAKSDVDLIQQKQPDCLWQQCVLFISQHLESVATFSVSQHVYSLRDDVFLDPVVCEAIFEGCYQNRPPFHELARVPVASRPLNDAFFHIFEDISRTRLKKLNLLDSDVTDVGLGWLLKHRPHELVIDGCYNLTNESLHLINKYGEHLTTLHIGNATQVLYPAHSDDDTQSNDEETGASLNCPALKSLSLHGLERTNSFSRITRLVEPLTKLNRLDLSSCKVEVHQLSALSKLKQLYSLILYDVPVTDINLLIIMLSNLTQLRMLDLSQKEEHPIIYPEPEKHLSTLVNKLSHLKHLDLSGTNLAGFQKDPPRYHKNTQVEVSAPIPGLEGHHLLFLGLMNCSYEACLRKNIPADKITGDANEQQVLLSLHTYLDRPELLLRALNSLFHIFKFSECQHQKEALLALLAAMKRHPYDKHIQISASASLFYIVKGEEKANFSTQLKRKIINGLLDGTENHFTESTMLRNSCLTLRHFDMPQDVLYNYNRVVRVLLDMISSQTDEYVQRISIYLLNHMACQVDGHEKQLVGDLGAIQTLLKIIKYKLERKVCDDIMEVAWSTLWNVTDETALNCERFLKEGGMNLFVNCLEEFCDKEEVLRNMMGLLGNVAEVKRLRHLLMDSQFVSIFSNLLGSSSDGIEVSYNACGVLAHMVSDGPDVWTIVDPPRHQVLHKMVTAIKSWKLETKRNINYRSFEPILRLLHHYDTPESQHWAVWALANLTQMYPDKYCPLVKSEGGIELLKAIVIHSRPTIEIKELSRQVISRCDNFIPSPVGATASAADDDDYDEDDMDG